jgi:hypothetical protein
LGVDTPAEPISRPALTTPVRVIRTRRPLSTSQVQTSSMRHPFQTDTFDPGEPELVCRTERGTRLNEGFHIGASAWEVDGHRWILLHSPYPYPCPYQFGGGFYRLLTYPLPELYGEEPHKAMNDFERDWHLERRRLWSLEPPPPSPEPPPAPPALTLVPPKPRRMPRGRPVAIAGAVPLPGLEPWIAFGCHARGEHSPRTGRITSGV